MEGVLTLITILTVVSLTFNCVVSCYGDRTGKNSAVVRCGNFYEIGRSVLLFNSSEYVRRCGPSVVASSAKVSYCGMNGSNLNVVCRCTGLATVLRCRGPGIIICSIVADFSLISRRNCSGCVTSFEPCCNLNRARRVVTSVSPVRRCGGFSSVCGCGRIFVRVVSSGVGPERGIVKGNCGPVSGLVAIFPRVRRSGPVMSVSDLGCGCLYRFVTHYGGRNVGLVFSLSPYCGGAFSVTCAPVVGLYGGRGVPFLSFCSRPRFTLGHSCFCSSARLGYGKTSTCAQGFTRRLGGLTYAG